MTQALWVSNMFVHDWLPENILHVQLIPFIKNKAGVFNHKDTYRLIAIVSILSKLLEFILQDQVQSYILTYFGNQFGLKKSMGLTDISI